MNAAKEQAIEVMSELHKSIPYSDYCTVMDGLQEIEPLRDRDEELEELWAKFGDIPMNPKTECIEKPFMGWGAGVHREEIWHWFDKRHSKGVHYLLYREADGPERYSLKDLLIREAMCFECDSKACGLNEDGLCCYPLVHGKKPTITEENGCLDSAFP